MGKEFDKALEDIISGEGLVKDLPPVSPPSFTGPRSSRPATESEKKQIESGELPEESQKFVEKIEIPVPVVKPKVTLEQLFDVKEQVQVGDIAQRRRESLLKMEDPQLFVAEQRIRLLKKSKEPVKRVFGSFLGITSKKSKRETLGATELFGGVVPVTEAKRKQFEKIKEKQISGLEKIELFESTAFLGVTAAGAIGKRRAAKTPREFLIELPKEQPSLEQFKPGVKRGELLTRRSFLKGAKEKVSIEIPIIKFSPRPKRTIKAQPQKTPELKLPKNFGKVIDTRIKEQKAQRIASLSFRQAIKRATQKEPKLPKATPRREIADKDVVFFIPKEGIFRPIKPTVQEVRKKPIGAIEKPSGKQITIQVPRVETALKETRQKQRLLDKPLTRLVEAPKIKGISVIDTAQRVKTRKKRRVLIEAPADIKGIIKLKPLKKEKVVIPKIKVKRKLEEISDIKQRFGIKEKAAKRLKIEESGEVLFKSVRKGQEKIPSGGAGFILPRRKGKKKRLFSLKALGSRIILDPTLTPGEALGIGKLSVLGEKKRKR